MEPVTGRDNKKATQAVGCVTVFLHVAARVRTATTAQIQTELLHVWTKVNTGDGVSVSFEVSFQCGILLETFRNEQSNIAAKQENYKSNSTSVIITQVEIAWTWGVIIANQ